MAFFAAFNVSVMVQKIMTSKDINAPSIVVVYKYKDGSKTEAFY